MKVTLAANATHQLATKRNRLCLALFTGSISYSIGAAITSTSDELKDNIVTDVIDFQDIAPDTPIYFKAGPSGAVFQYRYE